MTAWAEPRDRGQKVEAEGGAGHTQHKKGMEGQMSQGRVRM